MIHKQLKLPTNGFRPVSKWDNVYSAICAALALVEKSGFYESGRIPTSFALGSRSALVFLSFMFIECKKDMEEPLTPPEEHLNEKLIAIMKVQPGIVALAASRLDKYMKLADNLSKSKKKFRRDERLLLVLVESFVPLWNSMEALPYSMTWTAPREER